MSITIGQKQGEGYPCTWLPVLQKEREPEASGGNCPSSLVSCTIVPPSLGAVYCYYTTSSVLLCSWGEMGYHSPVWSWKGGLGSEHFSNKTPMKARLHQFLHLPEILGFKSGSLLAFLTASIQLNFLNGLKYLLTVHTSFRSQNIVAVVSFVFV